HKKLVMFGHDGPTGEALSQANEPVLDGSSGTPGAKRTPALGGGVRARIAAGWRAEVDRAAGRTAARWQCAGFAAVHRTESLGMERGVGGIRRAEERRPGAGGGRGGGLGVAAR